MDIIGRRSELMAELFLQELAPQYLQRPSPDFGYDFLVSFPNPQGGLNTFGVEVKGTDKKVRSTYQINEPTYLRLVESTIPGFLLVADVKRNELFYAWPTGEVGHKNRSGSISLPVIEIDSHSKKELKERLRSYRASNAY